MDRPNVSSYHSKWERPLALRMLGLALVAAMLSSVWLSWAFYSKAFVEYDDVKLVAVKSGLALPENADVKLRGMIVGVVRDTRIENGRVTMTLGMDRQLIDRVPRNVRAEVVPKTMLGEKYVSLVPVDSATQEHLRAGDTITNAVVPVEVEELLNDAYPLLTAVPPGKVATTLTAMANTLEGRGDSFGKTLEASNGYLKKLNPESEQAVADLVEFGRVSNAYASQMDKLGVALRNSAKLSDTVTDKESELAGSIEEAGRLGVVLENLIQTGSGDIVALTANSVRPLGVGSEYAELFPCFFRGLNALVDVANEGFTNNTIHGAMTIADVQPTRYGLPSDPQPERPVIPTEADLESFDLVQPDIFGYLPNPADPDNPYPAGLGTICRELDAAADGHPRTRPLPIPPKFWKLFGIKNSHNGKLGTDADYNRTHASGDSWATLFLEPALTQ